MHGLWRWEWPYSWLSAFRRTGDQSRMLIPVQLKSIRPLSCHNLSQCRSSVGCEALHDVISNWLICWLRTSCQILPCWGCYYTVLWVFTRRFKCVSQVPGESARSSVTSASLIASWNLWTFFETSCFLIASSTNTRNSRWALPDEPKVDDLTLTCAPRMQ